MKVNGHQENLTLAFIDINHVKKKKNPYQNICVCVCVCVCVFQVWNSMLVSNYVTFFIFA